MTDAGIEKFTGLKPVPPKNRGAAAVIGQRVVFLKQADTPYFKGEVEAKIPLSALGAQYQIGDRITVIDLPNGEVLCVALSLDDLENRLYGHDGADFKSEAEVITAIREHRFEELEKWFIPTEEILENHLYNNRNIKSLKLSKDNWYWSCTKSSALICNIRLSDKKKDWDAPGVPSIIKTRLVRAKLRRPAQP